MQSYNLNQLNVLVIERHVGIHRTIREILRHFGTRAVWDTGCLKEAQELIEEKQPDLIFTGLAPAFDGIGLVAKRLEFLEGSEPPTVRISSSNPSYPPYERTVDEVTIIGRVVGRWERL